MNKKKFGAVFYPGLNIIRSYYVRRRLYSTLQMHLITTGSFHHYSRKVHNEKEL